MISDALEYPFKSNIVDYFVGGFIWSMGAIFIFPFLLLYGYLIEVLRKTIRSEDEPPMFTNISLGKILIDGIAYSTIAVIYWFIGVITMFTMIIFSLFIDYTVIYILVLLTAFIVSFLISYTTRASVLIYAENNEFEKSFSPKILSNVLLSKDFFVANIIIFILWFTGVFSIFSIIMIPIIGWIFFAVLIFIFPLIMFYYLLFKFRFLGLAYKKIDFKNSE